MAYVTGNVIRKGDYNLFVTGAEDGTLSPNVPNLGILWGQGFGRYGYGQDPMFIAPVESGQVIRAQHWDNLDAVLSNVIDHQLGENIYAGLPGSQIASGQLIAPISTFLPNIELAYANVGRCFANSDDVVRETSYSGLWGNTGATTLKFTQTLTFDTADAARYFFNAGGKIKLAFSFVPSVANNRAGLWSNIVAAAGTVEIGYRNTNKIGGSGTVDRFTVLNTNNGGFWAQSAAGTPLLHFKQMSTMSGYDNYNNYNNYYGGYGYGYGSDLDFLTVEVTTTNNDGQNGNLGRTITVTTNLINGSVLTPNSSDEISGSVKVGMVVSKPSGLYFPVKSWTPYTFSGTSSAVA